MKTESKKLIITIINIVIFTGNTIISFISNGGDISFIGNGGDISSVASIGCSLLTGITLV